MKAVIQVVGQAELSVDEKIISKIGHGLVVFFCVERGDLEENLAYFAKKIANLRIFADENDKTNLSIKNVNGEILLVSQFTLAGDCSQGNRPYFASAENPERANEMYLKLATLIEKDHGVTVKLGVFGEHMIINQTNLGPFTILLEKK